MDQRQSQENNSEIDPRDDPTSSSLYGPVQFSVIPRGQRGYRSRAYSNQSAFTFNHMELESPEFMDIGQFHLSSMYPAEEESHLVTVGYPCPQQRIRSSSVPTRRQEVGHLGQSRIWQGQHGRSLDPNVRSTDYSQEGLRGYESQEKQDNLEVQEGTGMLCYMNSGASEAGPPEVPWTPRGPLGICCEERVSHASDPGSGGIMIAGSSLGGDGNIGQGSGLRGDGHGKRRNVQVLQDSLEGFENAEDLYEAGQPKRARGIEMETKDESHTKEQ